MEEGQADDQPIYEFVLNWSKDCRIVQFIQVLFQFHPSFQEFYSDKIKIKFEQIITAERDSININHESKPMLYNLGLVFQIVNSPQQKKIHQTKVYSSPLCLVLTWLFHLF